MTFQYKLSFIQPSILQLANAQIKVRPEECSICVPQCRPLKGETYRIRFALQRLAGFLNQFSMNLPVRVPSPLPIINTSKVIIISIIGGLPESEVQIFYVNKYFIILIFVSTARDFSTKCNYVTILKHLPRWHCSSRTADSAYRQRIA